MNTLPRNMSLKSFDPHRPGFMCKHEADVNPPITKEAEALFRQGMAATSYELIWPKDTRDYAKAAQFWQQAADRGHWKAAMNLAGLYEQGRGVEWDTEKAVQIVEALMNLGVPAAFDRMGTYHLEGIGVKSSVDRAYAFWQLAADMGNPSAQAYLGSKLDAAYDSPNQGFWGNREVALKMLECSYAQGNSSGAYELGLTLSAKVGESPEYYARALQIYHDGVKFGSQQCANALNAEFDEITPFTGNTIDTARSDRYGVIAEALRLNPDLRFPNLDKVLPLPPAKLPLWDGDPDTLIDAAKALVPLPDVKPTPGSQRTGRAHIPQDHMLAMPSPAPRSGPPLEVGAVVPHAGYWLPQLYPRYFYREREHAWMQAQVPHRYDKGERFESVDRSSLGVNHQHSGSTVWRYAGVAVAVVRPVHPQVIQGIARASRKPQPALSCRGHRPCPSEGIWFGHLPDEHPRAPRFNRWDRQTYVRAGQSFPDPAAMGLPEIATGDVHWTWCDNANPTDASGLACVTLTDLTRVQGESPKKA